MRTSKVPLSVRTRELPAKDREPVGWELAIAPPVMLPPLLPPAELRPPFPGIKRELDPLAMYLPR